MNNQTIENTTNNSISINSPIKDSSNSTQFLQSSNSKKYNIIASPIKNPLKSPLVERTKVPEISIYPKFNLKKEINADAQQILNTPTRVTYNIMASPIESPLESPIVEKTRVPEISVYPHFNIKKDASGFIPNLQSSNSKKYNIIASPIESPLTSPIVEKTKVPEINVYPKFNIKIHNKENPLHDRKFLEIKTMPIPKEVIEPLSTIINKPLPFEKNSVEAFVEVKFPLNK
jgi:hypothetical protein